MIFRKIDGYSATLTGVQVGESEEGGGGEKRPFLPILKVEKNFMNLERKVLIASIIGLNSLFKM